MSIAPGLLEVALDAAHKSGNTNPVQVAHVAAAIEAVTPALTHAALVAERERIANALHDRAHEDMYVMEPGCISIGWAQSIARGADQ